MRTKNDWPCKDCTERHAGCHATCEKYAETKKVYLELKDKVNKERYKDSVVNSFEVEQKTKVLKKQNHKKGYVHPQR